MPKYKTVNPLSMIPKKEDLPEGKSLYDVAKTYAPNIVKEVETPYNEVKNTGKLLYNAAMGEDVEGLPLGAEFIPGVSLAAKIKQGKTPGLFDILDVPDLKGISSAAKLASVMKAANLAVNPDLIKMLGKWIRSDEFEKRFAMLPKAVRESWAASFGDLHSAALGKHRNKIRPDEPSDVVHTYPVLGGGLREARGLYTPMNTDVYLTGVYKPKLYLSDDWTTDRTPDLIHEGTHFMDEAMGTAGKGMRQIKSGESPFYHPYVETISKDWIDKATKRKSSPFRGADREAENIQENTGLFSPIFYKWDSRDPYPDTDPSDWLADDPHGKLYFIGDRSSWLDDYGNDKTMVSSEGLAQFVESIPYGFNSKNAQRTPPFKTLVEYAEKDPRRDKDFTIDFEPTLKDLEIKLNKRKSFKDWDFDYNK